MSEDQTNGERLARVEERLNGVARDITEIKEILKDTTRCNKHGEKLDDLERITAEHSLKIKTLEDNQATATSRRWAVFLPICVSVAVPIIWALAKLVH